MTMDHQNNPLNQYEQLNVTAEERELLRKARQLAEIHHGTKQHPLFDIPFMDHLDETAKITCGYIDKVADAQKANVMAASYAHLLMQYCGLTYNEIRHALNQDIAEIVYLLTPLRGKNRQEQYPQQYWQEYKLCPHALHLKICTRIANAEAAKKTKSNMYAIYYGEVYPFIAYVNAHSNSDWQSTLIKHLTEIFKELTEI